MLKVAAETEIVALRCDVIAKQRARRLDEIREKAAAKFLARAQLAAAIAVAERHPDVAISELRHAVALQGGLPNKEPPAWYYPIRETLGARLALAGKRQEARTALEDDLRRNPNNPRSLFGLAAALGRTDPRRAAQITAAFRRAWSHTDTRLSLNDL